MSHKHGRHTSASGPHASAATEQGAHAPHSAQTVAASRAAAQRPGVPLPRWWWWGLTSALAWTALSQLILLISEWTGNPLARVPLVDAAVYWYWAERIAHGYFFGNEPLMSAPLYPFLVGLLRALHGDLPALYAAQAVLHLATVALLAFVATRRFGPTAGLLAAALYALLAEPAFFTGRVLNCSAQLLALVALWWALERAQRSSRLWDWVAAGALTGLNTLLNPPMLLAIGLLGAWAWWCGGWRRGLMRAAVFGGAAVLLIAPATYYNWHVSHEFIPVSAQAGLTFAHGNSATAAGTYEPVPGISGGREEQNLDARRYYRDATGRDGTWNDINRFFFNMGLRFWREQPGRALWLLSRKARLFATGQHIGDIYVPTLERAAGYLRWSWLNPLPLAWLMLPALVIIVVWARRPRCHGTELVLFGVPLLIVLTFFYSPRYRLPATPIVAAAAAVAVTRAMQGPRQLAWAAAVGGGVLCTIGLGFVNQWTQLDNPANIAGNFHMTLATTLRDAGQYQQALREFELAAETAPDIPEALIFRGDLLLGLDRGAEALTLYRQAIAAFPASAAAERQLAKALLASGEAGALEHAAQAVKLDAQDWEAQLLFGQGLLDQGEIERAAEHLELAARGDARYVLGLVQLADVVEERGDAARATAVSRLAYALAPDDPLVRNQLAWRLAVTAGLSAADRALALELVPAPDASADGLGTANAWDTRAAALAATARFIEAAVAEERAVALVERVGQPAAAREFRQRLALYQAGKPYVAPPPTSQP